MAAGRDHEPVVRFGVEDFSRRINRYYSLEWLILPAPKNAGGFSDLVLKQKEGETILASLKKEDYLVALDGGGKELSSAELADFLQNRGLERSRRLIFLIGGAYGLDVAVLERANFHWSLGRLTFPHQLVRLILAEQVYRACTILKNEKYHHS
jgi:23S rRNA (pseudouridine1915-N3)-methyltransferase